MQAGEPLCVCCRVAPSFLEIKRPGGNYLPYCRPCYDQLRHTFRGCVIRFNSVPLAEVEA
jgi:hypothetical protein